MPVTVRSFGIPKTSGDLPRSDDYCLPAGATWLPFPARLAVSDGATESIFAGLWARLLVRSFCSGAFDGAAGHAAPPSEALCAGLGQPQRLWRRLTSRKPLPWYAALKLLDGAAATLLGLVMLPPGEDNTGDWMGLAVGDSCLFQARGDCLIETFPIARPQQFGPTPHLVGTRAPLLDPAVVRTATGRWRDGDRFLLMTDAIAEWFLWQWGGADTLARRDLLGRLCSVADPDGLRALVETHRESVGGAPAMKDDDVTLMVAEPRSA